MVTRAIRCEMRKNRPVEMPMQQFRALRIVHRHPNATLSFVAEHLALTTASASKLIEASVKQGLVTRADDPLDRRRIEINLTEAGESALAEARVAALGRLDGMLAALSETDQRAVMRAMDVLREAFSDGE